MSLSMGIFKGVYRSQGIYFDDGHYTLDGSGHYRTMQDARDAIDRMHAATAAREAAEKTAKLESGAIRCERHGENVTVHLPDGPQTMTMRRFRQSVFEIEERYGRETIFA